MWFRVRFVMHMEQCQQFEHRIAYQSTIASHIDRLSHKSRRVGGGLARLSACPWHFMWGAPESEPYIDDRPP